MKEGMEAIRVQSYVLVRAVSWVWVLLKISPIEGYEENNKNQDIRSPCVHFSFSISPLCRSSGRDLCGGATDTWSPIDRVASGWYSRQCQPLLSSQLYSLRLPSSVAAAGCSARHKRTFSFEKSWGKLSLSRVGGAFLAQGGHRDNFVTYATMGFRLALFTVLAAPFPALPSCRNRFGLQDAYLWFLGAYMRRKLVFGAYMRLETVSWCMYAQIGCIYAQIGHLRVHICTRCSYCGRYTRHFVLRFFRPNRPSWPNAFTRSRD